MILVCTNFLLIEEFLIFFFFLRDSLQINNKKNIFKYIVFVNFFLLGCMTSFYIYEKHFKEINIYLWELKINYDVRLLDANNCFWFDDTNGRLNVHLYRILYELNVYWLVINYSGRTAKWSRKCSIHFNCTCLNTKDECITVFWNLFI